MPRARAEVVDEPWAGAEAEAAVAKLFGPNGPGPRPQQVPLQLHASACSAYNLHELAHHGANACTLSAGRSPACTTHWQVLRVDWQAHRKANFKPFGSALQMEAEAAGALAAAFVQRRDKRATRCLPTGLAAAQLPGKNAATQRA